MGCTELKVYSLKLEFFPLIPGITNLIYMEKLVGESTQSSLGGDNLQCLLLATKSLRTSF